MSTLRAHPSLATYVQDHLAGAAAALELLRALQAEHAGEPLGAFAGALLAEVRADRATLVRAARRAGVAPGPLKTASAWVAAKAGRLKLGRRLAGDLGTLEALEALALGILGKQALWRALREAEGGARRLALDLDQLLARAEEQHARVERWRLAAARWALRAG